MMTVADTGFVVALLNQTDLHHQAVSSLYTQQSSILLPQTVLAKVAYLLGREAGIRTVVAFLHGLPSSRFQLIALTLPDLTRTAEILEEYVDSRIDFVDASVMAIAERYNSRIVFTLDQRDFRLFRPRHCNAFELLP